MKILKLLSIALIAVTMASCGGDKNKSAQEQNPEIVDTLDDSGSLEDTGAVTLEAGAEAPVAEAGSDEVSSSSSSSQDWDAFLDEYENYVTKLAALSKKVTSGDMSAMTEYASLVASAERLQNKLENAESEMTSAQVARLNKIVAKMASSMM